MSMDLLVSKLQAIAKLIGKSFQLVLQEELAKLNLTSATAAESVFSDHEIGQLSGARPVITAPSPVCLATSKENLTKGPQLVKSPVTTSSNTRLTASDMNPPEIQKVVVEHIVRNEEAPPYYNAISLLQALSGRLPRPNNEADNETWRSSAKLLPTDPALSDLNQSRKIVDSLLPPASDFIKHLGSQALPFAYLQLIDSAYGTLEDGDELHRLQVVLHSAMTRGNLLMNLIGIC